MTTVSGISTTGIAAAADSAKASQGLGKDAFLTLLITQLQNQDPLNPADSTEFTAQLAQFSSLEQLSNVNKNLETLSHYQASINNAQAVSFIGKEIVAKGNTLDATPGMPVSLEFDLGADARQVVVSIYDASGKFVREQVMTGLAAGRQNLTWDGKDSQGNPVSKGVYSFEVIANGPKNEKIVVTPFARGRVTGVTFDNDTPLLLVGGRRVAFADVLQVSQAEAAAQRE